MTGTALILWALAAGHEPAPATPTTGQQAEAPHSALTAQEQADFRALLKKLARCSTGKTVYDPDSGFYLPKQKRNCR